MRKFISALFCIFTISCFAQNREIDSMQQLLQKSKEDTNKISTLFQLGNSYYYSHPDSVFYLSKSGLQLAQKVHSQKWEALCIGLMGYENTNLGNYPKALDLGLQSLRLAENSDDPTAIAMTLNYLGVIYEYQNEYRIALEYYLRSLPFAQKTNTKHRIVQSLTNIADTYFALNINDSSLYYSNLAYQHQLKEKDNYGLEDILANMGNIYSSENKTSLAIEYFKLAITACIEEDDETNLCGTLLSIAEVFQKQNKNDSAFAYGKKAMADAIVFNSIQYEMLSSSLLSSLYESGKNTDSAFKYLKLTISLKDSLYSQEKSKSIHNMTFQENIRQQEIAEQKKKDEEAARKNIQRGGIAVFIPIFFLFVLLLSRTKVKSRTIEFLGIVGLLLFFEFITDLIYPYISNWTNESPIWETLIFVILAACLEPISFKLEHFIKRKLIHKPVPVLKTQE